MKLLASLVAFSIIYSAQALETCTDQLLSLAQANEFKGPLEGLVHDNFKLPLKLEPFTTKKSTFPIYKVLGENDEIIAIFKPGGKSFKDAFIDYNFFTAKRILESNGRLKRDKAVYELAQALGMDNVPYSTIGVSQSKQEGTFMEFVKDFYTGRERPDLLAKASKEEIQKIALFDTIIAHKDRHSGNWMINESGKLILIDNDISLQAGTPMWMSRQSLVQFRPDTKGVVLNSVKKEILQFDEEKLVSILRTNEIPEETIMLTKIRLQQIKADLRAGVALEKIMEKNSAMIVISCGKFKNKICAIAGGIIIVGSATGGIIYQLTGE